MYIYQLLCLVSTFKPKFSFRPLTKDYSKCTFVDWTKCRSRVMPRGPYLRSSRKKLALSRHKKLQQSKTCVSSTWPSVAMVSDPVPQKK